MCGVSGDLWRSNTCDHDFLWNFHIFLWGSLSVSSVYRVYSVSQLNFTEDGTIREITCCEAVDLWNQVSWIQNVYYFSH